MVTALALSTLMSAAAPGPQVAHDPPASVAGKSRWRLGAGYYGELITHPGAYAEVSWTAAEVRPFSFSLGGDIGAYHHRRNHTGLFARAAFASRVTFAPGLFIEPRFVLGYAHTFVDGDGYFVVDDQERVREARTPGQPNVVYGFGLGLGYEVQRGAAAGLGVLLRAEVLGRAPYNDYALSQFALLAGLQWRFGARRAGR